MGLTYDQWISAVLRLGEAKGLQMAYREDPARWGYRLGTFIGYCSQRLAVWAGAGEQLLGPAVYTSPEDFTAYWPVCMEAPAVGVVAPAISSTVEQLRLEKIRSRRVVPWRPAYATWRAVKQLFGFPGPVSLQGGPDPLVVASGLPLAPPAREIPPVPPAPPGLARRKAGRGKP